MKFGGSILSSGADLRRAARLVASTTGKRAVVVSAIHGVTNALVEALERARKSERGIPDFARRLSTLHRKIVAEAGCAGAAARGVEAELDTKVGRLERLLLGISFTGEVTPRTTDALLSFGERLSAPVFAAALRSCGVDAASFDADEAGIVTDGEFSNATALLPRVERNFRRTLVPAIGRGVTPVITGYFGADREGRTTTFGRGGSDYSAAVVAGALHAGRLEMWKDVDGFMTADVRIVPGARLVRKLSYGEAAELAYFGARILHPRTVEPLLSGGIPMLIRSFHRPNGGTLITSRKEFRRNAVKGVAFSNDVAVVKVHGAGVGHKPGVLLRIASAVSGAGLNIKSVITSQTCISLLFSAADAGRAAAVLRGLAGRGKVVERVELADGVALVAVVGEGLLSTRGLAARVFAAVASQGINVEAISAGASRVAYYFIVNRRDLPSAVRAVHGAFFQGGS